MDIKQKVILITGASSGIDEGIARELGAAGAKLVLGARRQDRVEKLVEEIRSNGGPAHACALDVTSRQSCEAFVAAARERHAAALPAMSAQGSGQIINIGSIGALAVSPTAGVYCATKFAVRAISDGLRQENGAIRVTLVNPGVVESELADSITDETAAAAMKEYRQIRLQPSAIARAVRQVIEAPADVDTNEITIRPTEASQ